MSIVKDSVHVSELLLQAQAVRACDPPACLNLLRHAELRGVKDARTFLLQLRLWNVCPQDTIWALRCVFNRLSTHKLWIPLTFSLPCGGVTNEMPT